MIEGLADHNQTGDTRLVGLPGAVEVFVKPLTDALQQQAHRFAGNCHKALDTQNAVGADGAFQGLQQTGFLGFGQLDGEGIELVVVVLFVPFQVMVGLARIDMQLGLAVQAQQHVQR